MRLNSIQAISLRLTVFLLQITIW